MAEVQSELQSVLASRFFRQSRSLAKLLRYICGKALVGDTEPITEYTIAVDVLGKPADFKDSKDASVRVEVHRLRKRLAEFYESEGAAHAVRIIIPTGQYTPQFLHSEPGTAIEAEPHEPAAVDAPSGTDTAPPSTAVPTVALPEEPTPARARHATPVRLAAAATLALAVVAASLWLLRPAAKDDLDLFWNPVLASQEPILLCIGNWAGGQRSGEGERVTQTVDQYQNHPSEMVQVSDAETLSRFAGLLQSKGKRYRVVSQSDATFTDLRASPAVLIGLLNNDWTERLVGPLRFSVERPRRGFVVLRDRENPTKSDWSMDYGTPLMSVARDYALVLRVLDPKTGQMVVTAAGISVLGTLAAGEFLTNRQEFSKIRAVAPRDWESRNFELVLSTDVIRGRSGRPTILAAHFW